MVRAKAFWSISLFWREGVLAPHKLEAARAGNLFAKRNGCGNGPLIFKEFYYFDGGSVTFAWKLDSQLPADAPVSFLGAHTHLDSKTSIIPHENVEGVIVIPDASLLFSGDYKRAGFDLSLSKYGREHIVHDYFRAEKRATLGSPDGATLSSEIVDALTGYARYVQSNATPQSSAKVIGAVVKLAGDATAVRNGVAVSLHVGDNVYKNDVIQSASDSLLGITFIDGTAFSLSSNARMVLNDMVYDPNGSSNSSFLSLVQGTISFVAGQTAKNGTMRVDTPVATMGIRGTAVFVEIAADNGPTKFSVLAEPDGTTGSFNLYDKISNSLIGTVSRSGQVTVVTPTGFNQLSVSEQAKTQADLQNEKQLVQQVFQLFYPGFLPDNSNPKSAPAGSGSLQPQPQIFISPTLTPGDHTIPIKFTPAGPTSDPLQPQIVNLVVTVPPTPAVITTKPVIVTETSPTRSFVIADQVTITDNNLFNSHLAYIPGSAVLQSLTGPATLPAGINLAGLVTIDPNSGVLHYDPAAFAFLGEGQSVTYVVAFDSQSGANIIPETVTFTVNGINDPPLITGTGAPTYSEKQPAIVVNAALTVSDVDSPVLAGATVLIVQNFDAGEDALGFVNTSKITGSYNSATGVLTLTGTATIAEYQSALRSVTYLNTSDTPHTAVRDIAFQVDDGASFDHASNISHAFVAVATVNDTPVITDASFAVSQGKTVLITSANVAVTDSDSVSFIYTISNVINGVFQTTTDGTNWIEATVFSTSDLNSGHVRFVDSGSPIAPTFSIQVDDGQLDNSLSNTIVGSVSFTPTGEHQPVGTDVFLGGTYVEIGVSGSGSLGSANPAPAGFHPSGFPNESLVVNFDGGSPPPVTNDFTLPGTPEDSIVVGHDGLNYANDERLGFHQISTTTTDASDHGQLEAITSGTTADGLHFNQIIQLHPNSTFFETTITLRNDTGAVMHDVRFMRSFDPDQDAVKFGQFETNNDVLSSPTDGGSLAIAQAAGPSSHVSVNLVAFDSNARASNFGFTNHDVYAPAAFDSPIDLNGATVDESISLTFAVGDLAPGQSVTKTFFTSFNQGPDATGTLNGTPGNDLLIGTPATNAINGGAGNDTLVALAAKMLTGGAGSDTFVFQPNYGSHTITDFNHSEHDRIDLSAFVSTVDPAWISTHISQSTENSADTLVNIDASDQITLKNVVASLLTVNDFILHPGVAA